MSLKCSNCHSVKLREAGINSRSEFRPWVIPEYVIGKSQNCVPSRRFLGKHNSKRHTISRFTTGILSIGEKNFGPPDCLDFSPVFYQRLSGKKKPVSDHFLQVGFGICCDFSSAARFHKSTFIYFAPLDTSTCAYFQPKKDQNDGTPNLEN